jgi:hypothetical protein
MRIEMPWRIGRILYRIRKNPLQKQKKVSIPHYNQLCSSNKNNNLNEYVFRIAPTPRLKNRRSLHVTLVWLTVTMQETPEMMEYWTNYIIYIEDNGAPITLYKCMQCNSSKEIAPGTGP